MFYHALTMPHGGRALAVLYSLSYRKKVSNKRVAARAQELFSAFLSTVYVLKEIEF